MGRVLERNSAKVPSEQQDDILDLARAHSFVAAVLLKERLSPFEYLEYVKRVEMEGKSVVYKKHDD
ncbi:MAG: hypothetical protein AAB909_02525 [Patescibacteria group bacterium]